MLVSKKWDACEIVTLWNFAQKLGCFSPKSGTIVTLCNVWTPVGEQANFGHMATKVVSNFLMKQFPIFVRSFVNPCFYCQ